MRPALSQFQHPRVSHMKAYQIKHMYHIKTELLLKKAINNLHNCVGVNDSLWGICHITLFWVVLLRLEQYFAPENKGDW